MRRIISILLLFISAAQLTACGSVKNTLTENDTVTITAKETVTEMSVITETEAESDNAKNVILVCPDNNATVSLLNEEITNWLNDQNIEKLTEIFDWTEKCTPIPVVFEWNAEDANSFELHISQNEDMSGKTVYRCDEDGMSLDDLYPGTEYFWYVEAQFDEKTVKSDINKFRTLMAPKTVKIDGVSNVRDLGGYVTEEGKHIKYGVVYRGADLTHITDEGIKKAVDVLGIRTELDLRNKYENGVSPLGENIKYVSVSAPYYGYVAWDKYKEALLEEIRVFADPDNYPIYFHCALGRDRTGTLAYILLAVCGVSEEDIYTDYYMSFFSDMGGYTDAANPTERKSQLHALNLAIAPGQLDKPLSEKIAKKLIKLGITEEEIKAIRANLTEE